MLVFLAIATVGLHRFLSGKNFQGALAFAVLLALALVSGRPSSEEGTLVVRATPNDVLSAMLGCRNDERATPGFDCRSGVGLSDDGMANLKSVAARAAVALNEQECVFVGATVHDVIACGRNIKPTSLRKLIGYQERHLPSNSCLTLNVSTKVTHTSVVYDLGGGSVGQGLRERSITCMNPKTQAMEFVDSEELWRQDLEWLANQPRA